MTSHASKRKSIIYEYLKKVFFSEWPGLYPPPLSSRATKKDFSLFALLKGKIITNGKKVYYRKFQAEVTDFLFVF